MLRRTVLTVLPGILLSLSVARADFFSIDAMSLGAVSTGRFGNLFGINASGDIVGAYTDAGGKIHGYLLSAGTFIDFPLRSAA